MARKRNKENEGLPARWRRIGKSFYFQVPKEQERFWDGKKLFNLGKNLANAYRIWTERIQSVEAASEASKSLKLESFTDLANAVSISTINELIDRYFLEVLPKKAAATQTGDRKDSKMIRKVFGALSIADLKPSQVYQFFTMRSKKTKNLNGIVIGGASIARHEVAFLSKILTYAVMWGCIDRHPFKGELRLEGSQPRDRYIEDWEILECLALKEKYKKKGSMRAVKSYIKLKLLTGMDQSDLLRLEVTDAKDDGIHNQRNKTSKSTGKRTIYQWNEDLRLAWQEAISCRPALSKFLFCTRRGQGYINEKTGKAAGWNSMWQRFMKRILTETKVTKSFTSHDLRAKAASDATSLEHARALLAHADSKTTQRVYRRKPEMVQPIPLPNSINAIE